MEMGEPVFSRTQEIDKITINFLSRSNQDELFPTFINSIQILNQPILINFIDLIQSNGYNDVAVWVTEGCQKKSFDYQQHDRISGGRGY